MSAPAQKYLFDLISVPNAPHIELSPVSPSQYSVYHQLIHYHERSLEHWRRELFKAEHSSFQSPIATSGDKVKAPEEVTDPYRARERSVSKEAPTIAAKDQAPPPLTKPKPGPLSRKPSVDVVAHNTSGSLVSPAHSDTGSFVVSPVHSAPIHKHSYVPPAVAPQLIHTESYHSATGSTTQEDGGRKRATSSPSAPDPRFMQNIAQQAQGVQRRMSSVDAAESAKAAVMKRPETVQIEEEEEEEKKAADDEEDVMSPEEDEQMYNRATRGSMAAAYRPPVKEGYNEEQEVGVAAEKEESRPQPHERRRSSSKAHKLVKKKSDKQVEGKKEAKDEKEKGKGFFGMFSGKE